jgi:hypothetical protein
VAEPGGAVSGAGGVASGAETTGPDPKGGGVSNRCTALYASSANRSSTNPSPIGARYATSCGSAL